MLQLEQRGSSETSRAQEGVLTPLDVAGSTPACAPLLLGKHVFSFGWCECHDNTQSVASIDCKDRAVEPPY